MRYVVTDDFVAAHGWTPDATAKALAEPLARIGVLVERARGFGHGGFQSPELPLQAFNLKKAACYKSLSGCWTAGRLLDQSADARSVPEWIGRHLVADEPYSPGQDNEIRIRTRLTADSFIRNDERRAGRY